MPCEAAKESLSPDKCSERGTVYKMTGDRLEQGMPLLFLKKSEREAKPGRLAPTIGRGFLRALSGPRELDTPKCYQELV